MICQEYNNAARPLLAVASLYYLETIRALSGQCEPVLTYVAVADITKGEMMGSIGGVVSQVFSFWLEAMVQRPATQSRNRLLERHLVQLLPYATHPSMSSIAGQFVQPMLERFPHLHWSSKACFTLFDLLNDSFAESEISDLGASDVASAASSQTQEQPKEAKNLCRSWIARATQLAPTADATVENG